MEAFF